MNCHAAIQIEKTKMIPAITGPRTARHVVPRCWRTASPSHLPSLEHGGERKYLGTKLDTPRVFRTSTRTVSKLQGAAGKGDLVAVMKHLEKHPGDVNERDQRGLTALHWASYRGHLPVVRYLLERGAAPSLGNDAGYRPLMVASREGWSEVVACLLDGGADIDSVTADGRSALMFAALYAKNVGLIQILIGGGGNPNHRESSGATVLMYGAMGGNAAVASALLRFGADLKAVDDQGRTALFFARDRGFADVVQILVEAEENWPGKDKS